VVIINDVMRVSVSDVSSMLSPHKKRNLTPVLSTDQEMTPARTATDTIFYGEGRVAATNPESICSLHSFTARYSKCLMFPICMEQ
jgi:hypothetical protein